MQPIDAISRLDSAAAKRGMIVKDIDLSHYMNEEHHHLVKSASSYAEEVATLIYTPDEDQGRQMPWGAFKNKFSLRPGELTIWTGYKGHGKSAFISQVVSGTMQLGDKWFVISPEFRPSKVIERMVYQKVGRREVEPVELNDWFEWADDKLWLYDAQASLKSDDVVALCRYAVDKYKVNHILIDSLMKVGIAPDDYGKQKRFVDLIQSIAHNNNTHIHLVAHARKGSSDDVPPRLLDIKGTSEIADMAENVFVVWRNKEKEKHLSMGQKVDPTAPDALAIVEAQRNAEGWVGGVPMSFNKVSMRFLDEEMVCPL